MRNTVNSNQLSAFLGVTVEVDFDSLPIGMMGQNETEPFFSFIEDTKYIDTGNDQVLPAVVLTNKELASKVGSYNLVPIIVSDPRVVFFNLHNKLASKRIANERVPTRIDASAEISHMAAISETNVVIERDVLIEANVSILPNVTIGAGSIIRAGAIVGSSGFEYKRTSKGLMSVVHDGHLSIGENVEIGGGSHVGQGFSFAQTEICTGTKLDALVHIAHGSKIGTYSLIAAGTIVSGSVRIGHNVWIGPGCVISNGVLIGDNAFVGIGSVVLNDVAGGTRFKSWRRPQTGSE